MYRKSLYIFCALVLLSLPACSDDEKDTGSELKNDAGDIADAGHDVESDVDSDVDSNTTDAETEPDTTNALCEVDADCAGGTHQAGTCDSATKTCEYTCDEGYADCNGDASDGCEVDLAADADNCGACGTVCESDATNRAPVCVAGEQAPSCGIDESACLEGFVDFNGDATDGCECEMSDPEDAIDAAGVDGNCDGVDGILEDTVFVASSGDDANAGLLPGEPVATLAKALELAAQEGRSTVLVAGGEYVGAVALQNGVSLYGGYVADFSGRAPDTEVSRIVAAPGDYDASANEFVTVEAAGIGDATVVDHITIVGFGAENENHPGASTLALRATDSAGLRVQNAEIIGGAAADGEAGAAGGIRACTAPVGGAGGVANSSEKPCTTSSYNGREATPGLDGALANLGEQEGLGGAGGQHKCNGAAGNGADGTTGASGDAGADGALPAADVIGVFSAGAWTPAVGVEPGAGSDGGGGGGGGAGGNYESGASLKLGGNGGQGGAGGCGGEAGANGQPGGSSFGIVVVGEAIEVVDTAITLGIGGDGGGGGQGGVGESGAAGGANTPAQSANAGRGGEGGFGGDGGVGGDGVGGLGGNSVGVATVGVTLSATDVSYEQGSAQAGAGGAGAAGSAPGGVVEEVMEVD
ncbi:hypothetical protein [Bradymonas sediminis]|uniref:hypothetical protein n=1 Tax=Bradymonas sediminis TaxID=1548548 RepID=UPI0010D150A5|nr:hypothetical protein [Bradymonas sediminis]TDP75866.1 hypothetical protein DFR33_103213 [Bradymonas sediminis]